MNKRLHLISNAHIDTVWQWEWEEGAAEAISTFRTAAQLCDEFDGYIFCHNEAQLYMWINEYDPQLFAKIKEAVQAGKWHITGGWYNQPDCNMPSGEALVRNALFGRHYFKKYFGTIPATAFNVDSFGHSRGLVQILQKSGYNSYMFCRPFDTECTLPSETFTWVGYDGSTVTGHRINGMYNSRLGQAVEKVSSFRDKTADGGLNACLWGVGNHGGGPSRKDINDINQYIAESTVQGDTVVHSIPEQFFAEVHAGEALPEYRAGLNPSNPGCYTSQMRIKQLYRQLESQLFVTEKMCVHAGLLGMTYPAEELHDAQKDMLTAQFHDTLTGTSVQPVEESSVRQLNHGLEILTRLRVRAFFKLAEGLPSAQSDEIPIVVYNPHPYTVEDIFSCEFMLWDQNWEKEFSNPTVFHNGSSLPTQAEKEQSNVPIDWRKRVVFRACLTPASINYFVCKIEKLPKKPDVQLTEKDGLFVFMNGRMDVTVNAHSGLVDRYCVDGKEILMPGAFEIGVFTDTEDPWSMTQFAWETMEDSFKLLSPERSSVFSGVKNIIPSVRVIEDGDTRTVIEAVFGYGHSFAVIRYLLPKSGASMDVELRLLNAEKKKMFKLILPAAFGDGICEGETIFGREHFTIAERENVSQRYCMFRNESLGFSVANDGIYGSSYRDNKLMLTLLRSAAYTAHPIDDREILPQDRFSPYIDQGEQHFKFRFTGGTASHITQKACYDAALVNQPPFCLSFFPNGDRSPQTCAMQLTVYSLSGGLLENGTVEVTAFKQAEDNDGYIIRLFNHLDTAVRCEINIPLFRVKQTIAMNPFAVDTFSVEPAVNGINQLQQISMMEL